LQLENPWMLMQALVQTRRIAKLPEQPGRWPRGMAQGQKKPLEQIARTKGSVRPPQSPRAWAALGRGVPFVGQAFPAGARSLPAWKMPGKKPVARKQD
jgi:hypothetical protein